MNTHYTSLETPCLCMRVSSAYTSRAYICGATPNSSVWTQQYKRDNKTELKYAVSLYRTNTSTCLMGCVSYPKHEPFKRMKYVYGPLFPFSYNSAHRQTMAEPEIPRHLLFSAGA